MTVASATDWVRDMVLALTEPHHHENIAVRWDESSWIVAVPTSAMGPLLGDGGANADALRRLSWAGASARRLLQHAPWLRPEAVLSIRDSGMDAPLEWAPVMDLEAAIRSALEFVRLAARGPVSKGAVTVQQLVTSHPRFRPGAVCVSVGVPEAQIGRLIGRGGATLEDLRTVLRCHLRARGWRGGSVLVLQPTNHRSPHA
jgi:predicted RNA-binding protein YlqC (UPF0109 family)